MIDVIATITAQRRVHEYAHSAQPLAPHASTTARRSRASGTTVRMAMSSRLRRFADIIDPTCGGCPADAA